MLPDNISCKPVGGICTKERVADMVTDDEVLIRFIRKRAKNQKEMTQSGEVSQKFLLWKDLTSGPNSSWSFVRWKLISGGAERLHDLAVET